MADTNGSVEVAKAALPASIRVAQTMTPNEMRALKAVTGRSLTELLGGDPEDMEAAPDRLQALVWVALRRAGFQASWDEAGDVAAETDEEPADPTPTASSSSSSASVASGG